ncbi:hypothetical protein GOP47_0005852 [Adiantum capillus-veneris]|uniref:Uncharacterized protein n=1 Tax=Adiantum capillus-veneris TaxID=13818 RepID=A0A9D4V721_ADICA|nr:hypothetical protein GOP47_0005852 [Adiantum capillus-veneris]
MGAGFIHQIVHVHPSIVHHVIRYMPNESCLFVLTILFCVVKRRLHVDHHHTLDSHWILSELTRLIREYRLYSIDEIDLRMPITINYTLVLNSYLHQLAASTLEDKHKSGH